EEGLRNQSSPQTDVIDQPTQSYRPGSKDDFDRLYRSTYQRIFATLVIILKSPGAAEDATQEAYLRAFRAWRTWKQDAPAEAWLFRIALNVAFTQRRRERLFEIGAILQRLGSPADPRPTDSIQSDLVRELRALPPKQARGFLLARRQRFTYRWIASS